MLVQYICIYSVSAGAARWLRKERRGERGGLYIAWKEGCCRSESMRDVNSDEFVDLMFTCWLWMEGSEVFRLSRDSVGYASGIKLQ